jgi:hypothetical protein
MSPCIVTSSTDCTPSGRNQQGSRGLQRTNCERLTKACWLAYNPTVWANSSVGRASDLHSEGHRFEPCFAHRGTVAPALCQNLICTPRAFVSVSVGVMVLNYSEAAPVNSVAEEYKYIAAHPCPVCGGQWRVRMQALLEDAQGHHYDRLAVVCQQCNRGHAFLFGIDALFSGLRG